MVTKHVLDGNLYLLEKRCDLDAVHRIMGNRERGTGQDQGGRQQTPKSPDNSANQSEPF